MRRVLSFLGTAAVAALLLNVFIGLVPAALLWVFGHALFPEEAGGSLVVRDGRVIGSRLIGQGFTDPKYFPPRPSVAGDNGYDGLASGGTNFAPMNDKLVSKLKENAAAYRAENGLAPNTPIPADAAMTSGSGLDPHIGEENALLQVARVARARGADPARVRALVESRVEGPEWGFLGDRRVNVLLLNLALDEAPARAAAAERRVSPGEP